MLVKSQAKIKQCFDKKKKQPVFCEFNVGDKVLVLLPVLESTLTSRFFGPFLKKENVCMTDYVTDTPDQKRRHRAFHINMLKPCLD